MKALDLLLEKRRTGLFIEDGRAWLVETAGGRVTRAARADASAASLKKAFEAGGFERRRLVIALPQNLAAASALEVPSTRPAELAEMAKLEALRRMPSSPEDLVCGYEALGTAKPGCTKVLLLAARTEDVSRRLREVRDAGLRPSAAVFTGQAAARLAPFSPGARAFVELGAAWAGFGVVKDGRLAFARGVSLAGLDLPARRERALKELKVSLASYGRQDAPQPQLAFILASPEEREALQAELPLSAEPLTPPPGWERTGLAWPPEAGAAAALGASLTGDPRPDLLPPADRQRAAGAERRRRWTLLTALSCALALECSGIAAVKLRETRARLEAAQQEWGRLSSQARELQRQLSELRLVRERQRSRPAALAVFSELHRVAPPGISLSAVSLEPDGRFSVHGFAGTLAAAVEAVNRLGRSALFEKVELRSSNTVQRADGAVVEFQLEGRTR